MAPGPGRTKNPSEVIDLVNEDVINLVSDDEIEIIPPRSAAASSRITSSPRYRETSTANVGAVAEYEGGLGARAVTSTEQRASSSTNGTIEVEVRKGIERAQSRVRLQAQSDSQSQAQSQANLQPEAQVQSLPQSQNRPTSRPTCFSQSIQTSSATAENPHVYAPKLPPSFRGDPCDVENCQLTRYRLSRLRRIYCHRHHRHKNVAPVRQAGMTDAAYLEALTSSVTCTRGFEQRTKQDDARAGSMDRMPDIVSDDRQSSARNVSTDRMPDLLSDDQPPRATKPSQNIVVNVPNGINNMGRVADPLQQAQTNDSNELYRNCAKASRDSAMDKAQARRSKPPIDHGRYARPIEIPDSSSNNSDSDEVQIMSPQFSTSKQISKISKSMRDPSLSKPIKASGREIASQCTESVGLDSGLSASATERRPASLAERVARVLSEAEKRSTIEKDPSPGGEVVERSKSIGQESALQLGLDTLSKSVLPAQSDCPNIVPQPVAPSLTPVISMPIMARKSSLEITQVSPDRLSSPAKRKRVESTDEASAPEDTPVQRNLLKHQDYVKTQAQQDARSIKRQMEDMTHAISTKNDPTKHQDRPGTQAQHSELPREQQMEDLPRSISDDPPVPLQRQHHAETQAQHSALSVRPRQNLTHAISLDQSVPRRKPCAIKTTASPFTRMRQIASSSRRASATSALARQSPLLHSSKAAQTNVTNQGRKAQASNVESSDEENLLRKHTLPKQRKRRVLSSSSSSSLSSLPPDMRNEAKSNTSATEATINAQLQLHDKHDVGTAAKALRVDYRLATTKAALKDEIPSHKDSGLTMLPERMATSLGRRSPKANFKPKLVKDLLDEESSLMGKVKSAHAILRAHLLEYNQGHDYVIKSRLSVNRKQGMRDPLALSAQRYRQHKSPFTRLGGPQDDFSNHNQSLSTITLTKQAVAARQHTGHSKSPQYLVNTYSSKVPEIPKYEYHDRAGFNQLTRNHLCLSVIPNYVAARGKEDAFEDDLHPENPYRDGLFHLDAGPAKLRRDRFAFINKLQVSRQLYSTFERFLKQVGCSLFAVLGVFIQGLEKVPVPELEVVQRLQRAVNETKLLSRPIEDYKSLSRLLPQSTQDEHTAALAACIAFENEFGHSIWLVAEQKAQTLIANRAAASEVIQAELLCRICFTYNCSKHGKYYNGGSLSDKAASKANEAQAHQHQRQFPDSDQRDHFVAKEHIVSKKAPKLPPTWDARRINVKQQVLSTKHRFENWKDAPNSTNIRAPRSRHSKTPGSPPEVLKTATRLINARPDDEYRCSFTCSLDRKAISAAPPHDVEQTLRAFSAEEQARGRFFYSTFRENVHVSCILSKILGKSCSQVFWLIENLLGHDQATNIADEPPFMGRKSKVQCGDVSKSNLTTKRKIFYPCKHEGDCETVQCQCFINEIHCEKSCGCAKSCGRRFQGCKCAQSGKACRKSIRCSCWKAERECDPDLCGTCGAVWVLDPMRRHLTDVATGRCANVAIQLARPSRLIVGNSQVAGFGLYAGENIKTGQYLGEYKGELISHDELSRREDIYRYRDRLFTFRLNREQGVDGEHVSNKLRFINNSLKDDVINCAPETKLCNTIPRIAMFATRDILPGDELFFNYGYKKKYIKNFLDFGKNGLERVVPEHAVAAVDAEESSEQDDTLADSNTSSEADGVGEGLKQPAVTNSQKLPFEWPIPEARRKAADQIDRPRPPVPKDGLDNVQAVDNDDDSDAWMDAAYQHAFQQQRDDSSDDDYRDDSADAELSGRGTVKRRKASFQSRSHTSGKSATPNRAAGRGGEDLSESSVVRGRHSRRGVVHFSRELSPGHSQSPETRGRRRGGLSESTDRTDDSGKDIDISGVRAAQYGRLRRSLLRDSWHDDDDSETRTPSESTGKRKRASET